MPNFIKVLIVAIFITGEILWQLFTFFAAWGNADSGNTRGNMEIFFPSFFEVGTDFVGNTILTHLYTGFSFFNLISIIISVIFIPILIYKSISRKEKRILSDEEKGKIKERQKDVMSIMAKGIALSMLFLLVTCSIIMNK